MRSKRTKIEIKQDKSLIIKPLSQNHLKSRIFAFLKARESLIENTRVLEGIVVKIFQRLFFILRGSQKLPKQRQLVKIYDYLCN